LRREDGVVERLETSLNSSALASAYCRDGISVGRKRKVPINNGYLRRVLSPERV